MVMMEKSALDYSKHLMESLLRQRRINPEIKMSAMSVETMANILLNMTFFKMINLCGMSNTIKRGMYSKAFLMTRRAKK